MRAGADEGDVGRAMRAGYAQLRHVEEAVGAEGFGRGPGAGGGVAALEGLDGVGGDGPAGVGVEGGQDRGQLGVERRWGRGRVRHVPRRGTHAEKPITARSADAETGLPNDRGGSGKCGGVRGNSRTGQPCRVILITRHGSGEREEPPGEGVFVHDATRRRNAHVGNSRQMVGTVSRSLRGEGWVFGTWRGVVVGCGKGGSAGGAERAQYNGLPGPCDQATCRAAWECPACGRVSRTSGRSWTWAGSR